MAKRAPYEKTRKERLEEWRQEQQSEKAWRAKWADLTRPRLRLQLSEVGHAAIIAG